MKHLRLHLTALTLLLTVFAQGQIGQGTVLIGGVGSFDVDFVDPDNAIFLSLNPDIGFFVTDNIAVGGSLEVDYFKQGDHSSTFFGISPFARLYFGETLPIFIHAQAGYLTNKVEDDLFEFTSSGPVFRAGPGVAIFLSQEIAIDLALLYTRQSGDFDSSNFGLFFGVQAYMGRDE